MIMKDESPNFMILVICDGMKPLNRSFTVASLPLSAMMETHIEASCESTVAMAAPFTPMENVNMKRGSSIMFSTAPVRTEAMPFLDIP